MVGGPGEEGAHAGSNGSHLKKGPWSGVEDGVLIDYVRKHGEGNWNAVQRNTGLQRCGKSCRLRWANHLRPNLKKGAFSSDEERLIIDLHSKLGNKWARISSHLPGRTDNEIKNYWNTRVKRRLRQGLPLYPNDLQPPPPQPPTFPLPLHKPLPNVATTTLPLFDPVSLSASLFTLHHPPPFLSSHHPIKRPNSYPSRPISTPSHLAPLPTGPLGFGDLGLGLDRCGSTDFDSPCYDYELPSNQLYQNVTDEDDPGDDDEVKISMNVGRTKSGLLDDLLQEAQAKVGGTSLKRERDDCGFQWDISSSENSSTGIKKEEPEDHPMNSSNEDLSNILDLIPSLVRVPSWCNDGGGRESSVGQSSVVSTDDNYNGLDQQQQFPSFGDVTTADYDDDGDWNPSCYTWDNLPKIC